jgi:hypothetical protein
MCAWYSRRVVPWAGIAVIALGIAVELVRERLERPLFANIYGVNDHWFYPWSMWVDGWAANDKNGTAVFADYEHNLLVVVGESVPRAFAIEFGSRDVPIR